MKQTTKTTSSTTQGSTTKTDKAGRERWLFLAVAVTAGILGVGYLLSRCSNSSTNTSTSTTSGAVSSNTAKGNGGGQPPTDSEETLQTRTSRAMTEAGYNTVDVEAKPDGVVILNGSTNSEAEKVVAEQVASAVDGVTGVENNLIVSGETADNLDDKNAEEVESELNELALLEPIRFTSSSAILAEQSKPTLDKAAEILTASTTGDVEIKGYTDSTGDSAANLTLSQARAETVKEYLVSKGVRNDRLTATGEGQENPKADNSTKEGRSQNRRIEFVVS